VRVSRPRLGRNVVALAAVSFFTDVSSEMIYPLLPLFLTASLGATASFVGIIEGAAEATSALLKLGSGWWSDRVGRRKPLVVAGYAIASIVRPLIGLAQTAAQVLAIRITDRVGKGIRGAPRDALIADSVDPSIRGRAFGVHRAADHAGGVVGPLVAFGLLAAWSIDVRTVFLLAAIPAAIAVVIAITAVREVPPVAAPKTAVELRLEPLGGRFWRVLAAIVVFTLGNSTDAFLLLRATQLGVPVALAPVLWAVLHVVKSAASAPGGAISDRLGRRPTIIAGWVLYAAVYLLFGLATEAWHAWVLFCVYGVHFGLTEGGERAMVADLVPASRRGIAYGWYYLGVGVAALPASVLFGILWDRFGSAVAFTTGASLALVASILLAAVPKHDYPPSRA
jgi:MFS family permease